MLKKRQEVERLAAAGKHKYEYDSDEDTSDGTWEHRYVYNWNVNETRSWEPDYLLMHIHYTIYNIPTLHLSSSNLILTYNKYK